MREPISVTLESFDQFWPDAKPLCEAHAAEVDGGVEPNRRFKLDERLTRGLEDAGVLKIFAARAGRKIVGYFTWNVHLDIESEGLLIGMQGAWYVAPGYPRAAALLWSSSVAGLKAMGVKCVFPHHRVQGRGSHLGRFFERRGAVKIQESYSLWIGESHA